MAASKHEMGIYKDMDLVYDLKILDKEGKYQTRLRKSFENMYNRMDESQKQAWDEHYDPIIEDYKKNTPKGRKLALWKFNRYMQDYLATVQSVDDGVGQVLDYLDENGLSENTIVVYTSDQGFYLGEHGWFDKRFMYEESFRTPLLARWPGVIKPGTSNSDLVQNLDFAQTFLDIAGADQPSDMQGASFKPLLAGKTPRNWRKSLYYHYYEFPAVHSVRKHEGVATNRYKLISFYEEGEWEFYDLKNDPAEMKSEYNNNKYKRQITELKGELLRLKKLYKVPQR